MKEQTLVLIKPDGVERNLIGEIIRRFENAGLKVIEMKMLNASIDIIEKHYPAEEEYLISLGKKSAEAGDSVVDFKEHGMMIVNNLRDYLSNGRVVAMIIDGENAIAKVREINGYTDPEKAEKGTIRADLGKDGILKANSEKRAVRNLIHASGNLEEAEKEIRLWFSEF